MKYLIPYVITGCVSIEAESKEEAQDKFERWGLKELAEQGELEAFEAKEIELGAVPKVERVR